MIEEYPHNRDSVIRLAEQNQNRLFNQLQKTSMALIRLAATENGKNDAITRLTYFEKLWNDVHSFYRRWKFEIIRVSEPVKTEKDALKIEIERLETEMKTQAIKLNTELIKISKEKYD